ncbi:MAG: hypothetical protein AAF725_22675 [Acidobacteriota bacterium]
MPEPGRAAATTLALLQHQRDICDAIAGRVQERWPSLAERSREEQESAIRQFVLERQLSDLAASRTTGDLIDRFLPAAARETTDETAGSLRRLASVAKGLCDAVALPAAPQDTFATAVTGWLDRFEVERVELGRLLVVADEDLSAALEPYLTPIQLAGIEAEGEYLSYLESVREEPEEPTMTDYMRDWHSRTYRPAVNPSRRALGAYIKARRAQNVREIGKSCRLLAREVIALLRSEQALQAPDERVIPMLEAAYDEMRKVASHCTSGRQREEQKHFAEMQKHLKTAAEFLSRYKLQP